MSDAVPEGDRMGRNPEHLTERAGAKRGGFSSCWMLCVRFVQMGLSSLLNSTSSVK